MLKRISVFTPIVLALAFVIPVATAGEHTQIITVNDYSYEIEVGGYCDPVNETIIIENFGEDPLVNPRITVDGRFDRFDAEAIAHEVTAVSRG